MVLNTGKRDQLELREIDGLGLDLWSVLGGADDSFWELCNKTLTLLIFEDFGPVFRDMQGDLHIEDLTGIETNVFVVVWREGSAIDENVFDLIGGICFHKGGAGVAFLTTLFFLFAWAFCLSMSQRFFGRRDGTIAAVESEAIGQNRDKEDEYFKNRFESRREIFFILQKFFGFFQGFIDINVFDNHAFLYHRF